MDMSHVERCDADECAYNSDGLCHTLAVTIGHEAGCPDCDTFFASKSKGGNQGAEAGIGACKMGSCQHNSHFECGAASVTIGHAKDHVHCLTFHKK